MPIAVKHFALKNTHVVIGTSWSVSLPIARDIIYVMIDLWIDVRITELVLDHSTNSDIDGFALNRAIKFGE